MIKNGCPLFPHQVLQLFSVVVQKQQYARIKKNGASTGLKNIECSKTSMIILYDLNDKYYFAVPNRQNASYQLAMQVQKKNTNPIASLYGSVNTE